MLMPQKAVSAAVDTLLEIMTSTKLHSQIRLDAAALVLKYAGNATLGTTVMPIQGEEIDGE